MPWQLSTSEQGIRVSNWQNFQFFKNFAADTTIPLIAYAIFGMNAKKTTINRSVGKIDEVLSYAGGLFSIIISFLGFFLNKYN